jgi:hypothetical protein
LNFQGIYKAMHFHVPSLAGVFRDYDRIVGQGTAAAPAWTRNDQTHLMRNDNPRQPPEPPGPPPVAPPATDPNPEAGDPHFDDGATPPPLAAVKDFALNHVPAISAAAGGAGTLAVALREGVRAGRTVGALERPLLTAGEASSILAPEAAPLAVRTAAALTRMGGGVAGELAGIGGAVRAGESVGGPFAAVAFGTAAAAAASGVLGAGAQTAVTSTVNLLSPAPAPSDDQLLYTNLGHGVQPSWHW